MSPVFGAHAADYARQGFRVFRIHANQKTGGARWRHGPPTEVATADVVEITRRAQHYPLSNIGIATGNGLAVLDIDPQHGGTRPDWAIPTREASTPSGGLHCWYAVDAPIRNSVGRVEPGVDVRGDGGMVVAPPSRLLLCEADGWHRGEYRWVTDEPLAFVPAWRFHAYADEAATNSDSDADARRHSTRRKRFEDVQPGQVHEQVLVWGAYMAAVGCEADELTDLIWQMVDRFPFKVDNAGDHIGRAIEWVIAKQRDAEQKGASHDY